ncbi:MAG TPA: diadenylate cyclase [Methanospirillum sp.]|nr:diadenylate cyclase [Methanospirillum sp.]
MGIIFIILRDAISTMKAAPWIWLLLLVMVMAGCVPVQVSAADPVSGPLIKTEPLSIIDPVPPGGTGTQTARATIAPIHTKEPEVKPPVDKSTVTPSISQAPAVPEIKSTPTLPTKTPTSDATAVQSGPGNNETASTYFQWGRAYEDVANYQAALDEYDKAIAREPYYADAWYHRSLCYEKLGMWDQAYESYRFLLTISPGYIPAQGNLSPSTPNFTIGGLPPGQIKPDGTPLLWVASGAGIAGIIAVGIVTLHRRRIRGDLSLNTLQSGGSASRGTFPDVAKIAGKVRPYYSGDPEVFTVLLRLAIEIAREGREGKPIGTAFILGDSDAVMEKSRQLILNPLAGHLESERMITSHDMRENVKELALVDGAFVVRENGIVEAAGRYISIDTSGVRLSKGFGTRHVSVAAITQETDSIGIVVSESGGMVRVFAKGKIIVETM